jgi:hypothetical protein
MARAWNKFPTRSVTAPCSPALQSLQSRLGDTTMKRAFWLAMDNDINKRTFLAALFIATGTASAHAGAFQCRFYQSYLEKGSCKLDAIKNNRCVFVFDKSKLKVTCLATKKSVNNRPNFDMVHCLFQDKSAEDDSVVFTSRGFMTIPDDQYGNLRVEHLEGTNPPIEELEVACERE